MKELVIYVHGKGGKAEEAEHYKPLFPKSDVIGFDYKSQNPWKAKNEFSDFYDSNTKGYDSVILIAIVAICEWCAALIYKGMKKHYGVKVAICVAFVAVILSAICIFMLAQTPMPL